MILISSPGIDTPVFEAQKHSQVLSFTGVARATRPSGCEHKKSPADLNAINPRSSGINSRIVADASWCSLSILEMD